MFTDVCSLKFFENNNLSFTLKDNEYCAVGISFQASVSVAYIIVLLMHSNNFSVC